MFLLVREADIEDLRIFLQLASMEALPVTLKTIENKWKNVN